MFKLNNDLLIELGLGSLPADEKNKMLKHIYETLEMRVGVRLANQMTDQQLDEFEAFINKDDQDGALHWLETNFPNYKDVVAQELDSLKNEIKQIAPQIIAATPVSNQPPSTSPMASPPVPPSGTPPPPPPASSPPTTY